MVLELLAALARAILVLHRHRPDAARDPPDHRVFRIHAVREEERQIRREIIDVHAACEVGLDVRKAVGQRKGELRNRIRAGLGDVIAGNRHRIEILHLMMHEVLLNIAHHLERELGREDAGVLPLILLEDVGLNRAAHHRQRPRPDLLQFVLGRIPTVQLAELVHLLIDRGIHEHRQDDGRRAVDRHRHGGAGRAQVESRIQHLHIVESGDRHPGIAHLAVDIGPQIRIGPVQSHGIERRGQAMRRHPLGHPLETLVGAERIALPGEHAGGILALALECEYAGGEREGAGYIFLHQEAQHLAVVLEARQRDLADLGAGQGRRN